MKLLLALALLLPLTGSPDFQVSRSERTVCTHGCESKYCKKTTCADKCKGSPCRGCWKH